MCNTASDIWDVMHRKHDVSSTDKRTHLYSLRREFEILEMGKNEIIDEYFARMLGISNPMASHGERMEQVLVFEKILRSMTTRFNYVVCSIEVSNDVTTLSIDELKSSLLMHEQVMKGQNDFIKEQALKIFNARNRARRGRGIFSTSHCGRGRKNRDRPISK